MAEREISGGWQPIETMPDDDSPCWIGKPGRVAAAEADTYYHKHDGWTHWMPRTGTPTPPDASETEGGA